MDLKTYKLLGGLKFLTRGQSFIHTIRISMNREIMLNAKKKKKKRYDYLKIVWRI